MGLPVAIIKALLKKDKKILEFLGVILFLGFYLVTIYAITVNNYFNIHIIYLKELIGIY